MKDFIPYTEALALKELGFDEKCIELYSEFGEFMYNYLQKKFKLFTNSEIVTINKNNPKVKICTAPTFSQAFRFFRENKLYQCEVQYNEHHRDYQGVLYDLRNNTCIDDTIGYKNKSACKTYEEAELECLRKLIEIVKNNKS